MAAPQPTHCVWKISAIMLKGKEAQAVRQSLPTSPHSRASLTCTCRLCSAHLRSPVLGLGTDSLPILWFIEAALVASLMGREFELVD